MAKVADGQIPSGIQVARLQVIEDELARDLFVGLAIDVIQHVYWQLNKAEEENFWLNRYGANVTALDFAYSMYATQCSG
jgi:lipopolysaccharide biosynthesis regulator YciM